MTKPTLTALTFLAALAYSPAYAITDLNDDFTDNPVTQKYPQRQQYAARTECEVHQYTPSSQPSTPASNPQPSVKPKELSLMERIRAVLEKDCGSVRLEKNTLFCDDYVCLKKEVQDLDCEYCPSSAEICTEGHLKERWRMDLAAVGQVEALLINEQIERSIYPLPISLGYALRPIGKNELYPLQKELTAREMKNLLNQGK